MTKVFIVTILLAALFPHSSRSEPAGDDRMAYEAAIPYVPRDPAARDKLLKQRFEKLVDLATKPFSVYSARIFGPNRVPGNCSGSRR